MCTVWVSALVRRRWGCCSFPDDGVLWPPVVFVLGPHVTQVWNDFLGRSSDVFFGQFVRDRAELVEQHQVADVEIFGDFP